MVFKLKVISSDKQEKIKGAGITEEAIDNAVIGNHWQQNETGLEWIKQKVNCRSL